MLRFHVFSAMISLNKNTSRDNHENETMGDRQTQPGNRAVTGTQLWFYAACCRRFMRARD